MAPILAKKEQPDRALERSHKPWLRAAQQKHGLLAKPPNSKQAAVKLLW